MTSFFSLLICYCPFNHLEKSTRPGIPHAVHQCARFTHDPKRSHIHTIIHLVKYLKKTRKYGLILKPEKQKSLESYVDAGFYGNWNKLTAEQYAITAKFRTEYSITFLGCTIVWSLKLQTQNPLSTTEAEYIVLSMAMREVISITKLLSFKR